MNPTFYLKATLVAAAMVALPFAQAANLSKADYQAGKTRIEASTKADKAACSSRADNAKDICVEEAKAKEKVALAEIEYGYTGKPADRTQVMVAKAESAYAVAKEKCDDKAGNVKDVCVQEAKATETKALADARMYKDVGQAETTAVDAKRDADYKVAIEKCDALAGDAKTSCTAAAKTQFGKI
ncbi:MAG TPA: hypothetical protein VI032_17425 [Burkholderiaceae bacterium]